MSIIEKFLQNKDIGSFTDKKNDSWPSESFGIDGNQIDELALCFEVNEEGKTDGDKTHQVIIHGGTEPDDVIFFKSKKKEDSVFEENLLIPRVSQIQKLLGVLEGAHPPALHSV